MPRKKKEEVKEAPKINVEETPKTELKEAPKSDLIFSDKKICPICKEKTVEFKKENGWFWADCSNCDSKTSFVKNEYMLEHIFEIGKMSKK